MTKVIDPGKKQGEYRVIEYVDPAAEDPLSEEEQLFKKFQQEFSEGENYASITVFRVPLAIGGRATKARLAYLFECGIDEYSYAQLLAKLRDGYGSGTYRLQGRDTNRQLIFNRSVEIEGAPAGAMPSGGPENVTSIMKAVQELMTAQQARTDALIAAVTEKPDPAATIAKWVAIFTPLVPVLTAFVNKPTAPAAPVASLLDELAKFGKIKDLVSDLGGGGGDGGGAESNFYDLAGKALETLGPVVGMAIQKGQVSLPAPGPAAGARPMPETSKTTPPTNGAQPMPRPQPVDPIVGQVKNLLIFAKGGQDPVAVADMVLENTPDEKLVDLKAFVSSPDVLKRMVQAVPEVAHFVPWFTKLKDEILRLIAEIEADTLAPAVDASGGSGSTEPNQAPAAPGAGSQ